MTTKRLPISGKMSALSMAVVLLLNSAIMTAAKAAQTGDSKRVNFHGTLKKKPCHIANDQNIDVYFEKVGVKRVDSQRYMQPVPYTLSCDEVDPSWMLMLSVRGIPTGFEDTALQTNANGLGIRILQDGKPMQINKPIAISYGSPPMLQAVPVQQSGVKLSEQTFSATATLMAEYQ